MQWTKLLSPADITMHTERGQNSKVRWNFMFPLAEVNNNPKNQCFNEDANNLVKRIEADLVYIDPPYNSRQYCDSYHLLENVARWEKTRGFWCRQEDG